MPTSSNYLDLVDGMRTDVLGPGVIASYYILLRTVSIDSSIGELPRVALDVSRVWQATALEG
jgi:hypothetical protein